MDSTKRLSRIAEELPVDLRTLTADGERTTSALASEKETEKVFFIGEDTPTPELSIRIVSSSGCHVTDRDDVLYIGDE